jgi:hypothetical protein
MPNDGAHPASSSIPVHNACTVRADAKAGFAPRGEWNDASGKTLLKELARDAFERSE